MVAPLRTTKVVARRRPRALLPHPHRARSLQGKPQRTMTTSPPPIRILLVDDHALLRTGLASVLSAQPGFAVCGEAANGEAAAARFDELRPDVTLMDLQMPVLDGVGAITKIRAR